MFWIVPALDDFDPYELKEVGDQLNSIVVDYESTKHSVKILIDYIKDYRDEYWVLAEILRTNDSKRKQTSEPEINSTVGEVRQALCDLDQILCKYTDIKFGMRPVVMFSLLEIKSRLQKFWDHVMETNQTIEKSGWWLADQDEVGSA